MKISVIICTYNREHSLTTMLQSIQSINKDISYDYEIILVDNNSKDRTKDIIKTFIQENNYLKYVFEPRQGISYARNAGIKHSTGEILAFTDDDVIIDKHWLKNIASFCAMYEFDAMGGKVLPDYPEKTPEWIKNCRKVLSGPIVCHENGEDIKPYDKTMYPFVGANMVIKKEAFNLVGGFNVNLGSGSGTMGDDTELFRRLEKSGKKILYNPHVIIYHPVELERISFKYFAKWHIAYGKYLVQKNKDIKDDLSYLFNVPRYLYREILLLSAKLFTSIFQKQIFVKTWCDLFTKIGMFKAYKYLAKDK